MVYQDRLETMLLQLYAHSQHSEWVSMISVDIFGVNLLMEQKHA